MTKPSVACFGLGADQKTFVRKLSKKFNIIGFDNNAKSPGIKFVKKYYNVPFSENDKIMKILIKEKITKIFSFATEAPQLLIGYLNTKLKINGTKYHQIKKISDKLEFRKLLKKKRIFQQSFYFYEELKRKKNLKNKLIAKPIVGSASEKIFILDNLDQIKTKHKNFIFEEYVRSKCIYHVDGFYFKKKFHSFSISKKIKSKNNFFVDKKIMFNFKNNKLKQKIKKNVERICSLIKISFSPIHYEFIYKNGKVYPIDFHLRGPGSGFYTYLMDKLLLSKILEIEMNPSRLIGLGSKNFYCYVYFLDNISEKKDLTKYLKRFSKNYQLKITYKRFTNKTKSKQNNARDRIGAFYFEFSDYKKFIELSNKLNTVL